MNDELGGCAGPDGQLTVASGQWAATPQDCQEGATHQWRVAGGELRVCFETLVRNLLFRRATRR